MAFFYVTKYVFKVTSGDNNGIKHEVRSVMLDDEPWFVAIDVCCALGVYLRKMEMRI